LVAGWSGIAMLRKKLLLISVIEPRISGHAAHNLVIRCTDSATGFALRQ
jgi:hypothetical protein